MEHPSRVSKSILVLIVVASAILSALRFNSFPVGAFNDDARYIVLTESLASNQGYRLVNFPGAPRERLSPPGWPLLLSPFAILFPENYQVFKLLALVFWLACLPLIYLLFVKRIRSPYLEILVAALAVSPTLISYTGKVMSETPYLFFSLLTFYLFDVWQRDQDQPKTWLLIAAALSAVYTYYIRTVGITLLPVIPAALLAMRRFKQAGLAAVVICAGVLPLLWMNLQGGGFLVSVTYMNQNRKAPLAATVKQIEHNAQTYLNNSISGSLVPLFSPDVTLKMNRLGLSAILWLLNVLILFLVLLGVIISHPPLGEGVYLILYLIVITLYTPTFGSGSARFILPLIPFLLLYFVQALVWLMERISARRQMITLGVVSSIMLIIVLLSLSRNIQDWRNPVWYRRSDLSIGATWINQNTPPASIVMTINPLVDYIYMHRKTIPFPEVGSDLENYIQTKNIDYILVSLNSQSPRSKELKNEVANRLVPLLQSYPKQYALVYTSADQNVMVYECR